MNLRPLLQLDARLSNQLRVAERPGLLRNIAIFFAHSGDSWFWGLALIVLWLVSDSGWKKWAVVLFGGISVLAVMVMTLKFIIRRRRPEGEWGGIYRNTDPHSFPSGHAARSFLIAVVVTALGPTWLAIILWLWAPLVSLARVAMGVHYLSDILAGAMTGVIVGLIGLEIYQPLLAWFIDWIGISLW
ncbi:MAG: phosphatase PAP2 family protein [Anaerolineales bacterium]